VWNRAPRFLIGFFLFLILFHAGCAKKERKEIGEPTDEILQPVSGGTLVVGITGEPDGLNPLTALNKPARDAINLIFRPLASINADLVTFSPQLAKSWEFSPDSLRITFHLRTDVLWHDSVRFTARDVVFTYRMHTDPQVAWDGIDYKEDIRQVRAIDDSTVEFIFSRRSPTMLMDAVEGHIVPAHRLKSIPPDKIHIADFNRHPIGTGPFRLVEWKSQQSLLLKKFPGYYEEGKPYLNWVVFKVVSNPLSLWQQVQSGEVDLMENVPARDFTRLETKWAAGEGFLLPISYLGRQYDYIGWNLIDPEHYRQVVSVSDPTRLRPDQWRKPHPLFGDQKIRAALTMAIDRRTLTQVVNQGMAIPMDGPIAPILWAYNDDANTVWPYDPERAQRYLSEAGWNDTDGDGIRDREGRKFSFELLTNSGNERREQAVTIIQEQLRQVGVEAIPRVVDPALLFGQLLPARDFDAVLSGWNVGLKMDLSPLFHSSSVHTPFHFTGYYSTDFDRLEAQAKRTFHREKAQAYWDQIAKLLSWDLPYTWLYYRREGVALHRRFHGVNIDKRGALVNVEEWWVPPAERIERDRLAPE
jgi:peptide/nickel transport system substrate-binding protein